MKSTGLFSVAVTTMVVTLAAFASAGVPQMINYQGRLTDSEGAPLDTIVSMIFTIYDDAEPTLGMSKWAETLSTVTVAAGLFDVTLGSIHPLLDTVFNDTGRYLGITVGTDLELTPRTRLVSTGYAHRVSTVDGAAGGDIYGDLKLHSTLTVGDLGSPSLPGQIEVTNGSLSTVTIYGNLGGAGTMLLTGSDGIASIALDGQFGTVYVAKPGAAGKMYLQGGGVNGSYVDLYDPSDFNTVRLLSSGDGTDGAEIELYQANQQEGVVIDADDASGANGGGSIYLYNSSGNRTIGLDGDTDDNAAFLSLRDAIGNNKIWLDPDAAGNYGAEIVLLQAGIQTVQILASETGSDGGRVTLYQLDGDKGVVVDGDEGGSYNGGNIYIFNGLGDTTVEIDGNEVDDASAIRLWDNANHVGIELDPQGATYGGAEVRLRSYPEGDTRVFLDAEDGSGGGAFIAMYDDDGDKTVHLDASGTGAAEGGAQLSLSDSAGTTTISLDAQQGSDGGANISIRTGAGVQTIRLDADYGGTGEGRVITSVLEITGGSDLSEQFDVTHYGTEPSPGMVVCIDPSSPGKLVVSSRAYDPTVAGIISGAGGIKPGMLMGQAGSVSDGQFAVALTGRAYCRADASYGSIGPGDLLTTSDTPGHAMKVTDYRRAQGAIIGKAMSALNDGTGLVLVLVSLQ